MRESPTLKKGRYDTIILDVLRRNPCSRKELLRLNKDEKSSLSKIPYSTLDQRLKQLEKYGFVEHIPDVYRIVEKIREADGEDVEECTKAISEALRVGNKAILFSRVNQLRVLSERNRIAHLSIVLQCLEECLESPILAYDSETFSELVDIVSYILFFERNYKLQGSDKIVERIQYEISPKVISLVRANPEFPDHHTIRFLGRCGTEEAVDTIFEKIKSKPSVAHKRIDTAHALAELYSKHKKLINQQFDALMEENSPKPVVEAATKLRQDTWNQLSIHFRG